MVGTYYDKKTKTMKRGDKPALTREEAIKVWNTRPRSADNELLTYDMAEEIAEIKKLYSESPHILDFTVKSGFKLPILNILMEFINRPKSTDGDEVERIIIDNINIRSINDGEPLSCKFDAHIVAKKIIEALSKSTARDEMSRLRDAAMGILIGSSPHGDNNTVVENWRIKAIAEALSNPNKGGSV